MAHVMSGKGIHVSSGQLVIFSQTKAFLEIKISNFHLKLGDSQPISIYSNDVLHLSNSHHSETGSITLT